MVDKFRNDSVDVQTTSKARADWLDNNRKSSWLNPLNMIELQQAVAKEADHVYFTLNRGRTKMLLTYPNPDVVYIEVDKEYGFVPCGTLSRQWIEEYFVLRPQ